MKNATIVLGLILVVGLFTWPSAGVLFAASAGSRVDLLARVVAFSIIALSYAAFVVALLYFSRRLPSAWSLHWKLLLLSAIAVVGSLVAPLATLPPVTLIKSICAQSSLPCSEPAFLSLVPHALHVATTYPIAQVFLAAPALLLLLWRGQNGLLKNASAHS